MKAKKDSLVDKMELVIIMNKKEISVIDFLDHDKTQLFLHQPFFYDPTAKKKEMCLHDLVFSSLTGLVTEISFMELSTTLLSSIVIFPISACSATRLSFLFPHRTQ